MPREMKDSGIEWIGEIPAEWNLIQLKRYATSNNGREIGNEVDKNFEDAIGVYGSGGVFKYTDEYMYAGTAVMFGRKGTLGKPLYVDGKFWAVDTMYYLTYSEGLHPRYNYYQLIAFDWTPHITQTALPSVVASEIVACHFAIPSLVEQKEIANYLDQKCAEIDSVIEQTKSTIEEYRKLKQSIITESVTKGIRGDRPMKDSGIEWIGEIQEDYQIFRLKHLLKKPLMYGANESGIPFDEDLPRYIRITDITLDGKLKDYGKLSLTEESARDYILENNDILFARSGATVGKAFIYRKEYGNSAFAGYLIKASVNKNILADYLFLYTQSSIYDRYSNLPIVLPTIDEQEEIVLYLDKKCAEIDTLIEKKTALLEEMEALKKSTIFEYVTGKKEV